MILSTHAVIGAGIVASLPAHPIIGVSLAFASHFVLDMIPHWDYTLYSDSIDPQKGGAIVLNRHLFYDALRIGGDGIGGLVLAYIFFFSPVHPWLWFFGAAAAMFPDFLQFVYIRFP